MSEALITIDRTELHRVLKEIHKFIKPKQFPEAIFRFKDNILFIEAGGLETGIPAEGNWPGVARIPASYLVTLAKSLPREDPMPIRVEANRLFVSTFSVLCIWKQQANRIIELPMEAPLRMMLAARLQYSDEEIENSGLSAAIEVAEKQRDKLLKKAVELLKPLGIEYSDLKIAVDTSIKQKGIL